MGISYSYFGNYNVDKTLRLDMFIEDDSEFPEDYKIYDSYNKIYWNKWREGKKDNCRKMCCCRKRDRAPSKKRIYESVEKILNDRLDVKNFIHDMTEFQIIKKLF